MRKWSLVILVGLLTFGVWAQALDIKDIDLSKATISLGGPDRVYITSVYYKGQEISIHLVYDGKSGAVFSQPFTQADKSLPDATDLTYATIKKSGSDGIMVSDVIIGNAAYSGIFRYNPSSVKLELYSLWSVPVPQDPQVQVAALKKESRSLQAQITSLEGAQAVVDIPVDLDVGYASLKGLGSDGILVSRVVVGGNAFSGILRYTEGGALKVDSMWNVPMPAEDERIDSLMLAKKSFERQLAALSNPQDLPETLDLSYASLKKMGDDSVMVERVIIGGQAYSGVLNFNADNKLAVSNVWTVPMPSEDEKIAAVKTENRALARQLATALQERDAAVAAQARMALMPRGDETAPQALPEGIDVNYATMKRLGTEQILIERIVVGGQAFSGIFTFTSDNKLALSNYWSVPVPPPEEQNSALKLAVRRLENQITAASNAQELPEGVDLSYATLKTLGDDSVLVSRVVFGGQAYSGVLKYTVDNKLAISSVWPVPMPGAGAVAVTAAPSADVAALQARIRELESQVGAAARTGLPTRVAASGFAGSSLLGDWRTGAAGASQQNAGLKYAKYAVNVNQNQNELLYEFTGRAPNAGWVGFGLHFLVSGESSGRGYGYGQSYLVWVTRDPSFYKTENAFVQLYRSYDDIRMVQLASSAIPDQIDRAVTVQAFYSRTNNTIIVNVNGVERLRLGLTEPLRQGTKIALRTLGGPVEFSNLAVKAN